MNLNRCVVSALVGCILATPLVTWGLVGATSTEIMLADAVFCSEDFDYLLDTRFSVVGEESLVFAETPTTQGERAELADDESIATLPFAFESTVLEAEEPVSGSIIPEPFDAEQLSLLQEAAILEEHEDVIESESEDVAEPEDVIESEPDICTEFAIACEPYLDLSDLRKPSGITREQLSYYMQRYCPLWLGLEDELLELDKHINLIFLLSVGRCETGCGEACVGWHNCFNIKGSGYGGYRDYSSYSESIQDFADWVISEYLTEGGLWYEGTGIYDVGKHYASERWSEFVSEVCEDILAAIAKMD